MHWHTGVAASLRNLPLLQALTALDTQNDHLLILLPEPTQYYWEATGMPLGCVQVAAFTTGHSNISRVCTCADLR